MEDVPCLVGDHGLLEPEPLRAHLLPLGPLRVVGGGGRWIGVGGRGRRGRGRAAASSARSSESGKGRGREAARPGERAEPRGGSEAKLRRAQRHSGKEGAAAAAAAHASERARGMR